MDINSKAYTRTAGTDWTTGADSTLAAGAYTQKVSCATDTYCLATNRAGDVRLFDGSAWSTLPSPPSITQLFDVDCATTSFCVAAGVAGPAQTRVWKWNGTAWSAPLGSTSANGWVRVACPAVNNCVMTGNPITGKFDGTTVTATNSLSDEGDDLACVSTTECFAGRFGTGHWAYDGSSWADATATSNGQTLQTYPVGCAKTGTFCAAGGFGGSNGMWTYDGSAWTTYPGTTGGRNTEVSCGGPTFCVAVTEYGQSRVFDGTSWGPLHKFARS
jgi:hypothetical protein